MHRQGNITAASGSYVDHASGYTVTVFPVGAVSDTGNVGAAISVYTDHSFRANDKVYNYTKSTYSGTSDVIAAVPGQVTLGDTLSVSAGDQLVNVGADSGTSSPDYDSSPVVIYSDPQYSNAISNSQVTTDSEGNYEYHYKGDGAVWELIRDSSGSVVGLIAGYGGGTRRNIADYGAAIDGSTDDTDAIQIAIDCAEADGGGEIFFPRGTTLVTGLTNDDEGVSFIGEGQRASTIASNAAAGDGLKIDFSSIGAGTPQATCLIRDLQFQQVTNALNSAAILLNVEFSNRVVIERVSIDNGDSTFAANGVALALTDINYALLNDVNIHGTNSDLWGVGIDIGNGVSANRGNVSIVGGLLNRCKIGARIAEGATTLVNNIQFYGTKFVVDGSGTDIENSYGVEVNTQGENIVISGCHFEAYDFGVWLNSARNVSICETQISFGFDSGSIGIHVDSTTEQVFIQNNRIVDDSDAGTGILIDADASKFVIGYNHIIKNSTTTLATTITNNATTKDGFIWQSVGTGFVVHNDTLVLGRNQDETITLSFDTASSSAALIWDENSDHRFEFSNDVYSAGTITMGGSLGPWVGRLYMSHESLTASTTQTQGQQPITKTLNTVTTGNANDTVTLPTAVAGAWVQVRNISANALRVFPASGDKIDGGTVNIHVTQAASAGEIYYAIDATDWYTLLGNTS